MNECLEYAEYVIEQLQLEEEVNNMVAEILSSGDYSDERSYDEKSRRTFRNVR